MSDDSVLELVFNADGSIKINASKMAGGESAILKELSALADAMGSAVTVEKHQPGVLHRQHQGQIVKLKDGKK